MGKKLALFAIFLLLCGCNVFRPITHQTTENGSSTQINANTGHISHIGFDHSDWKHRFDSLIVTQTIEFVVYDTLGHKVTEGKIKTDAKHGTTIVQHDTTKVIVTDTISNKTTIQQEDYTKKKTNHGIGFLDKIIILAVIVLVLYVIRLFRR